MEVKQGVTLNEENGWEWSRTGCWGRHLEMEGRKEQKAAEICILRSFMIFTFHHIFLQSVAKSANTCYILNIHNYALTTLTSWTGVPLVDKTC